MSTFGLNFVDDGIINNAVILANNGTGKSSIFAELKWFMPPRNWRKKHQNRIISRFKKEHYDRYVERFESKSASHCKVDTISGEFDLNNNIFPDEELRKIFHPRNFFDFDIYENGKVRFTGDNKDANSLHSIVSKSLGLEEFLQLQNLLLQIPGYRRSKESSRKNTIDKQIKEQKDVQKILIHKFNQNKEK